MTAEEMWNLFIESNPENAEESYDQWPYGGGSEEVANELAELTKKGIKTATASAFILYELEGESLPPVGGFNIILDTDGHAKCITKTKSVYTTPFHAVTAEHAFKEGEGDRSLDFWREVHREVWTKELMENHLEFSEDMLVVCEEFEVVYQ